MRLPEGTKGSTIVTMEQRLLPTRSHSQVGREFLFQVIDVSDCVDSCSYFHLDLANKVAVKHAGRRSSDNWKTAKKLYKSSLHHQM